MKFVQNNNNLMTVVVRGEINQKERKIMNTCLAGKEWGNDHFFNFISLSVLRPSFPCLLLKPHPLAPPLPARPPPPRHHSGPTETVLHPFLRAT